MRAIENSGVEIPEQRNEILHDVPFPQSVVQCRTENVATGYLCAVIITKITSRKDASQEFQTVFTRGAVQAIERRMRGR
jgi:hypothetical protein